MHDQAENLRRMMRASHMPGRSARVIAVTSGKGGVGKTNITVNMAIQLARMGQRMVILDVDLGLANIDVVMDLKARYNLSHVIRGEKTLQEVIVRTGDAVAVVPGASGLVEMADLSDGQRNHLIRSFDALGQVADIILVDTAAGISKNVMGFARAADEVIVVATPEPTSITDAYATIKLLVKENFRGKINLIVNMAASASEGNRTAARIVRVSMQFLRKKVYYLGLLLRDAAVTRAVQRRQPFALVAPKSAASRQVAQLAAKLLNGDTPASRAARSAKENRGGFIKRIMVAFGAVEVR